MSYTINSSSSTTVDVAELIRAQWQALVARLPGRFLVDSRGVYWILSLVYSEEWLPNPVAKFEALSPDGMVCSLSLRLNDLTLDRTPNMTKAYATLDRSQYQPVPILVREVGFGNSPIQVMLVPP